MAEKPEPSNAAIKLGGDVVIGETESGRTDKSQEGNRLFFAGAKRNTDPQFIERYNIDSDRSALRISMGDNDHGDCVDIGFVDYHTGKWRSALTVHADGTIDLHGKAQIRNLSKLTVNNLEVTDSVHFPGLDRPEGTATDYVRIDTSNGKLYQSD